MKTQAIITLVNVQRCCIQILRKVFAFHLRNGASIDIIQSAAAAEAYNHTLEQLDEKVSKYIDGNPIRIDGRPRASGIFDTVKTNIFSVQSHPNIRSALQIRAAVAHGIKVPPEFEDESVIDLIVGTNINPIILGLQAFQQEEAVVNEWFAGKSWCVE